MSRAIGRWMDGLGRALDELDRLAADERALALRAPGVSAWSVAQHVDHLAEANALCLQAAALLVAGRDERIVPDGAPTFQGRVVLFLGRIPRGRGRAPEPTVPPPEPDLATTRARLAEGRSAFARLSADPAAVAGARGRIPHPILGRFSAAQWVRFTGVHVRHHLAIAADVAQRSR